MGKFTAISDHKAYIEKLGIEDICDWIIRYMVGGHCHYLTTKPFLSRLEISPGIHKCVANYPVRSGPHWELLTRHL